MVRGLVQDGARIKMFADSALCLSIDLEECSAIEDDCLDKSVLRSIESIEGICGKLPCSVSSPAFKL